VSTLTRPRGPLPPRVYWTRRLVVIGLALALTVGIARLLTLGSDGSSPDQAQQAAAEPSGSGTPSASATSKPEGRKHKKKPKPTPTEPPLAEPTGPCTSSDVTAVPEVKKAVGGAEVLIALELRTQVAEACTWTVSPDTMTLKITSGRDDIWSSRECPAAISTREVVVRRDVGTKVGVQWNGKRSDADCTPLTEWAYPGFYHVTAAALAGEPSDVQFELTRPPRQVVTVTVTPTPSPTPGDGGGKKKRKNP
jgi:hypothetical protein